MQCCAQLTLKGYGTRSKKASLTMSYPSVENLTQEESQEEESVEVSTQPEKATYQVRSYLQ